MKDVKNRTQLDTPLQNIPFLVIDLETTGFRPWKGDEIISIGTVPVEQGCVCDEKLFHTYVCPLRPIPVTISQLTGITMQDVKKAPPIEQVLKTWLPDVHGTTLVAYGAKHDIAFLQAAMSKYLGTRLTNRVIDVYQIACWLHPNWSDHSLDRALLTYGIPIEKRHSADGDALMTAKLWVKWIQVLIEKGIQTMEDLYIELSKNRTPPR
nr:exonuclease domain-containing protein [Paenactinomyces guangxiensis]